MVAVDELLYNALKSDADIMQAVGGRIVSTCFEVGPDEDDNTPLPCIIITDDGLQNTPEDKDYTWESDEDHVQASVEVDAESPKVVKQLMRMCRKAIADYIRELDDDDKEVPILESVQSNGVGWDWLKPCYHSTITYNCIIENDNE